MAKKIDIEILTMREALNAKIKRRTTGILSFDIAMGGGLPLGKHVEVFGPEAAGKTSLCLQIVGKWQALKKQCMFLDAECTADLDFAEQCFGVNADTLWYAQPESGEHGLDIVAKSVEEGAQLIVVDSVAALTPEAELKGDMGDQFIGTHARMMGKSMRKLTALISEAEATILWVNQIREKIGVMFGSPETTPGGRALKFFSSVRARVSKVKAGDGFACRISVKKNKTAAPNKVCEIPFNPEGGYNLAEDIFDAAVELDVITKEKNTYFFGKKKLGTLKKSFDIIESDKKLKGAISKKVKKAVKNG